MTPQGHAIKGWGRTKTLGDWWACEPRLVHHQQQRADESRPGREPKHGRDDFTRKERLKGAVPMRPRLVMKLHPLSVCGPELL